jgi:hypothetical protein
MTGGVGADIGQCSRWASLEVGGSDLGDVPEGYDGNFHLGKLVIGPGARVRLVDAVDNGNRDGTAGGPEALYVHTLDFRGEDGILNLNGLNLYYEELTVNGMYGSAEGRVIDEPCSAPMPMTAIQLLLLEKEIGVGPR